MNWFDESIINALNEFARRWYTFDAGVVLLSGLETAKGGVFMAALWWAWFKDDKPRPDVRLSVVMAIVAAIAAVLLARLFATLLPYRDRPMHAEGFDFVRPYGLSSDLLSNWSAFPSDHATLFTALTLSLFWISRPVGIAAALYAAVFILLPRLYLGLHWPTDILAGAALGALIAWVCTFPRVTNIVRRPAFGALEAQPGLFYAAAFILTYQIAGLFAEARETASFLEDTIERVI